MNPVKNEIRIANLVAKKLLSDDCLMEEEERLFSDWLNESENHKILYSKYSSQRCFQEFENMVQISDQVEQWQRLDKLTRPRWQLNWRKWGACAAVLVLFMSFGLWLLHETIKEIATESVALIEPGTMRATLVLNDGQEILLRDQDTLLDTKLSSIKVKTGQIEYEIKEGVPEDNSIKYNTIIVPRGGIYSLVLSDGTKVFLNSESELKYPVAFTGKEREVSLKGEAFFDVMHHSEHPFVVKAGEIRTKVLGTTFDISAYADEPEIRTTLLSGCVEMTVDNTDLKEILKPGMQASWRTGSNDIILKEVNIHIQSLWRDGIIVLNDDELDMVMRMLSRWYNVTYEFKDHGRVQHTFTGKVDRNEDLGHVLKTLTLLGGPRFEIVGKTVYIY